MEYGWYNEKKSTVYRQSHFHLWWVPMLHRGRGLSSRYQNTLQFVWKTKPDRQCVSGPQTRVRNVLTTGRGLNHSGKTARCTLRWTGIEMCPAQYKATPTEVEQTKKFQDLSTRVANIIHFAGHYYLARDSISDELSGLWFLTRSLDRRTFLV